MNVLVLRFGNAIFEAVWSRRFVERVEICCLEEVDCKGRGGYFDAYGIIRDVTQNHLAQLLALVAMEQPLSLKADDVRREKVRALRACKVLDSRDVIRGQYDGYADDASIKNKKTTTETFAACKLFVDTCQTASLSIEPYAIDATRVHQTRSWVVSSWILSCFGPSQGRPCVSESAVASMASSRPRRRDGMRRRRRCESSVRRRRVTPAGRAGPASRSS